MASEWKSGVHYSERTDIGMRRANNQDSHAALPAKNQERYWQRGHLFVVADGMGAHAAGELASKIATEQIALHYFRNGSEEPAEALRNAVEESNAEIYQRGQQNPEFHNMGTTASAMAILPEGAVIAHVGDSRVYRLRNGQFEQLTFDHSLVWEMEASGQVNPNSALGQAIPKNVITRSLGPNSSVTVDVEGPLEVRAGDQFLLCSDGLSGQVEDPEIGTLMDCLPEELATRVLIDLANLRGGPDNSTVIIVRVAEGPEASSESQAMVKRGGSAKRSITPVLLGATAVCFALALVCLFLGLQGNNSAWGPMVIGVVLGLIAAGFSVAQLKKEKEEESKRALPKVSGGKAPYRTYNAAPTQDLYNKLGGTVKELRDAAESNNWLMDWGKIDKLQMQGSQALKAKQAKQAIRFQAEAIIETMHQLREQHNRAANETAIDY